jgi:putative MATE family efflux protein
MGTMPITRLLINMSWPAIVSMLIQALYNIIDSLFVARTGESALTALTLANPAQLVFIAVAVGTGVGVNSLISRRLGAKRYDEANDAAAHGIWLAIISGLVFAVLGFFLSGPFIGVFTDDPVILKQGTDYLMICIVFCIFSIIHIMLEKTIQATGNMILPMVASLIGCAVNIALDPPLIFGWGPFPEMGVAGAAFATVIAQIVSMFVVFYILFKKTPALHVKIKIKVNWMTVKEIYAVGLPNILMQLVMSIAQFVLNYIFAGFSATAVAVIGVYGRLQSFVFMPCFGINQGAIPIMGFNYGARNKKRLLKTLKTAFFFAFVIMVLGFAVFQIFPAQLLAAFDASENMLRIGIPAFRIVSICFLPASIGVISAGFFSATGHGFMSLIITLVRQFVFVVPSAIILAKIGGLIAIWWCFPASEILGVIMLILMMLYVHRKDIARLENPVEFDSAAGT